jgi:hypothetical protein
MQKMFLNWQYKQEGRRDLRLDWLRGYAIFAMAVVHLDKTSLFDYLTGGGVFLVGATEFFFFISGYTLGYISQNHTLKTATARLIKRTWVVYLTAISIAFGFSAVVLLTDFSIGAYFQIGSWQEVTAWIGGVLSMQKHFFYSDVLIAYVIFLGTAPLVMWGLMRKKTYLVIAVLGLVYFASQQNADALSLPFASFRDVAANSPIFFGGVVIGYHSEKLAAWWQARKFYRGINALVVLAGVVLIAGFFTDYAWFPFGRDFFLSDTREVREFVMPPSILLLVFLYIRFSFILIDAFWKPANQLLGWYMLPMGKNSLPTFNAHLMLMPLFFTATDDRAAIGLWQGTWVNIVYLGLLYGAVRLIVWLREGWLKRSPFGQKVIGRFPEGVAALTLLAFTAGAVVTLLPVKAWLDAHFP